jgi:hypothetical protein
MNRITYIFIVLVLFVGCTNTKIEEKKFVSYPTKEKLDKDYNSNYIQQMESYLNLNSIRNGVDSFEVRIYEEQAFSGFIRLYVLKNSSDSFIKKQYVFKPYLLINADGSRGVNEADISLMNNFKFNTSDTCFKNLIIRTGLKNLPTQRDIPNLKGGCLDGISYTIEIADKHSYRQLNYSNLDCYENSVENKRFEIFINSFFSTLSKDNYELLKKASKLRNKD